MHDYDAITRRAVFRNVDTRPRAYGSNNPCGAPGVVGNSKVVQKASAMSLDFEATSAPFHLVQLNGRCVLDFNLFLLFLLFLLLLFFDASGDSSENLATTRTVFFSLASFGQDLVQLSQKI